ncbi:hypothetical protein GCM10010197_25940 [Nocardioides luteus]|uniref:Uncharacterized protein n=1 Tax=Nocardioides luteus TaxID=1844 RepID=A0ABQ5SXR3_9ACTN|nr:hypothetical protein GCM10010197_25940 [Nocardioides luteus]GLJ68616.1 hypothetical protein GCM10017579_26520 [Nocardioides luteus]
MAHDPNSRAIASESRDWLLVKSLLQPGEVQWARVAVKFPHEGNASGHAFLTDRRVMFEFHERVFSVNLAVLTFIGVPPPPSLGDFIIEALVPGSSYSTTMKIRDKDAFHDFFPTLDYAARAAGAQVNVDASWGGEYGPSAAGGGQSAYGQPAPNSYGVAPTPGAYPNPGSSYYGNQGGQGYGANTGSYGQAPNTGAYRTVGSGYAGAAQQNSQQRAREEAAMVEANLAHALPAFLHEGESILAGADMIQNMTDVEMKVMATESRLIVVEGNILWASPLEHTHVIYAGGERSHLRVLADRISETMALTPGPPTANPTDGRRLVLRTIRDVAAGEQLHNHLTTNGGQVYDAWPEQ